MDSGSLQGAAPAARKSEAPERDKAGVSEDSEAEGWNRTCERFGAGANRVRVAGDSFQVPPGQGELDSPSLNVELKSTRRGAWQMPHAFVT